MKKVIFFFFFFFYVDSYSKEITNKTKIQVGSEIITDYEILIEKNFLMLINPQNIGNVSKEIIEKTAQDNLISRKIKILETNIFKVNADKNEVDRELFNFLEVQKLTEDKVYNFTKRFKINENYLRDIIELEIKWKNLIGNIYFNKININITEIDQEIQKKNIPNSDKEKIIALERNKVLNNFLSNHLELSKKKYLIQIL